MNDLIAMFATVFLAEFGDKTQLATVLFASERKMPAMMVFLASGGALLLSSAIATFFGTVASRYLAGALNSDRYMAPDIIGRNMAEGRIGLRSGKGFLNYADLDIDAYRAQRLAAFVDLLKHFGLARPPVV